MADCGVAKRNVIVAWISLALGIILVVISAVILHEAYETRESVSHQWVTQHAAGMDLVGSIFGKSPELAEAEDRPIRFIIGCSAAMIAAGVLQILASIFSLVGTGKMSRAPSRTISILNTLAFLTILISFICLLCTNQFWNSEGHYSGRFYFWVTTIIADGAVLVFGSYASWV